MVDEIRLRAMSEILAAERLFREQAEKRLREMGDVLTEIAYRLGGDKLETLRREDATVPKRWGPEDWRKFFQALALTPSSGWEASGWGTPQRSNGNGHHPPADDGQATAEFDTLRTENSRLQEQIAELTRALWEARRNAENNRSIFVQPTDRHAETVVRAQAQAAPRVRVDRVENYAYRHIPLAEWQPPTIPAAYVKRLESQATNRRDGEVNERRKLLFLWLLAVSGIAAQLELNRLLASREGISPEAGSLKRPVDSLEENNLVIQQTLTIQIGTMPSRLVVLRLSEDGKRLCQLWGYEIVENEWERMIRLHEGDRQEAHTLAVLLFTAHARLRGWKATVLPEVQDTPARPDVLIENENGERWYVEVETGTRVHENNAKWCNLAELQDGKVALCAKTVEERKVLVQDCSHWHGVATDLESLIAIKLKSVKVGDELWTERW
ncbi:MAG: hypothetical protein WHV66_00350 [Anaerolineales bacterium]